MRVDVSIVRAELGSWRVVGDVMKLIVEVAKVADAMLVVSGVPDLFLRESSRGEGVSALYELNAFGQRLVRCRGQE